MGSTTKVNRAICIFNNYSNAQAQLEGWGELPGVKSDMRTMTRMLEKHYDIVTLIDKEDIELCIKRLLDQWKDEYINRLHFHFSGHGFYNQTVDAERNEFDEVDSSQSITPIGECVVGNNGQKGLCSILQIQHLLSRANAEKITITLDCCRSLDRELGRTRERIKLIPMPKN